MSSFSGLLNRAKKSGVYDRERLVLEFTSQLEQAMSIRHLKKADLARAIGKNPAYITKVFKGNENFTLETMANLSRAVGMKLSISMSSDKAEKKQ